MDKPGVEIRYKLADRKRIGVEVSIEVKDAIEWADRKIRAQRRQDKRYRDDAEYIEGETEARMFLPQEDVADYVVRMDRYYRLYLAIDTLPENQRRRLLMHCVGGLTCRQIAEKEGIHHTTVSGSITRALRIIKKLIGE